VPVTALSLRSLHHTSPLLYFSCADSTLHRGLTRVAVRCSAYAVSVYAVGVLQRGVPVTALSLRSLHHTDPLLLLQARAQRGFNPSPESWANPG